MLKGLDLFSGIGGISLALKPWVKTIAYCEIEPYCQAVLLERMQSHELDFAPIWDDVTTLNREILDTEIDIIFGGFPCQDVSVAGKGAGIKSDTRSGLFFHIMRLVREYRPQFIFLENVAAICSNGLDTVLREIAEAGYDAKWCCVSASEAGAPHKRDRWWLLAYPKCVRSRNRAVDRNFDVEKWRYTESEREAIQSKNWQTCSDNIRSGGSVVAYSTRRKDERRELGVVAEEKGCGESLNSATGACCEDVANATIVGMEGLRSDGEQKSDINEQKVLSLCSGQRWPARPNEPQHEWEPPRVVANSKHIQRVQNSGDDGTQPRLGGNVDGVSYRVDRIKALGNSVVPQAARKAFETLICCRS